MRAVIQRVAEAAVTSEGTETGRIGAGLCALIGVAKLRIFEDDKGKMNRSVLDIGGQVLAVSQFTLLGDARGQNRPGFTAAERPEEANRLYEVTCEALRAAGVPVQTGVFRTHMQVSLVNDGPVTILLDSRKMF